MGDKRKHKKRKITKQDRKVLTPYTIGRIDEEGGWIDKPFNVWDTYKQLKGRKKRQNKRLKQIK